MIHFSDHTTLKRTKIAAGLLEHLSIFHLRTKEDGRNVGMIARKWSGITGAVEDLATELDRFSVTFPEDATIQERVL